MLKNAGTILQYELENGFDITIIVDAYMRTKERLFDAAGFAYKAKQGIDYAAPEKSADFGQEQPGLIRRTRECLQPGFPAISLLYKMGMQRRSSRHG